MSSSAISQLNEIIQQRKANPDPKSYTCALLQDPIKATRKLMEEAYETSLEITAAQVNSELAASEAADLIYHLMAALASVNVPFSQVEAILAERHGKPARHSTYDSLTKEAN